MIKRKSRKVVLQLDELHYWQMTVRKDIQSVQRSIKKCKQVGAELRAMVKEESEQKVERRKRHAKSKQVSL